MSLRRASAWIFNNSFCKRVSNTSQRFPFFFFLPCLMTLWKLNLGAVQVSASSRVLHLSSVRTKKKTAASQQHKNICYLPLCHFIPPSWNSIVTLFGVGIPMNIESSVSCLSREWHDEKATNRWMPIQLGSTMHKSPQGFFSQSL